MRHNSSPIDRIQDLVRDYNELEAHCNELEDRFAKAAPNEFRNCSTRPISRAVIHETERAKVQGKRTIQNREYMRRIRSRQQGVTYTSSQDMIPIEKLREEMAKIQMTDERMKEIIEQVDAEADLKPEDLAPGKLKL